MLRVVVLAAVVAGAIAWSEDVFFASEEEGTCPHNVRLMWTADVGSAAFAAPLITDLFSDGTKEIVLPTFTHYVEALDGATGNDVHGWPFAHASMRSQSSALHVDLERDGTPEVMVSTYDGQLVFFRDNGTAVRGATVRIPRQVIKKRWRDFSTKGVEEESAAEQKAYELALAHRRNLAVRGNKPQPSTPKPARKHEALQLNELVSKRVSAHVAGTSGLDPRSKSAGNSVNSKSGALPAHPDPAKAHATQPAPPQHDAVQGGSHKPPLDAGRAPAGHGEAPPQHPDAGAPRRHLLQVAENADAAVDTMDAEAADPEDEAAMDRYGYDDYYGDEYFGGGPPREMRHTKAIASADGQLSTEALASMDLVFHPELFETARDAFDPDGTVFTPRNNAADPRHDDDHVLLDAHILSTPVVVDIDLDGNTDVIVPVSFYLDAEEYADPAAADALPKDVDHSNYVMGALVAIDVITGKVKWSRELEKTTKRAKFPAYLLSSPTVINLDDDGVLDVVVVAASGEVHAFDAHGNVKMGWPQQVGPSHGQPLAEDVNGDGQIDICVGDVKGQVTCFHRNGQTLWVADVGGPIGETPTAGDVNGDGHIDVVVATVTGFIMCLDGRFGKPLPGFPVSLGNKDAPAGVVAPALLVNLNDTSPPRSVETGRGLHIVVPALDGAMYIVSGTTGCSERIDTGHHSYTMILADDLLGNGKIDLVLTTLTGALLVFETDATYEPLRAWPSAVIGINGLTARDGYLGVLIRPESRQPHDVRGESFHLMFEIVDNRASRHNRVAPPAYFVAIHVGHRLLLYSRMFFAPGVHTVHIPAPLERMYGTVFVTMRLPNGQQFEDSVAIAFNMHFLDAIKFLVVVPFAATMIALMFVHKRHTVKMPRHHAFFDEGPDGEFIPLRPRSRRAMRSSGL